MPTNGSLNPPLSPLTDKGLDLNEKITRKELFGWLDMVAQNTANIRFVPFHAVMLSLIIEKLGITDEELDAHHKKMQTESRALEASLHPTDAKQVSPEEKVQ